MPFLTVVTVVRNAAPTIERTLDSVACQTRRDLDYVVIDGASTDGTLEILRARERAFSVLISEPDSGISNAFNKGLRNATGDFVYFLNAGDTLAGPQVIDCVACEIMNDSFGSQAHVYYGDAIIVEDCYERLVCGDHRKLFDKSYLWNPICHQAAFVRRDILTSTLFDESLRFCMDLDLWYRLSRSGARFQHLNFPICRYATGGFTSHPKHAVANLLEHWRVRRKHGYTSVDPWYLLMMLSYTWGKSLLWRVMGEAIHMKLRHLRRKALTQKGNATGIAGGT